MNNLKLSKYFLFKTLKKKQHLQQQQQQQQHQPAHVQSQQQNSHVSSSSFKPVNNAASKSSSHNSTFNVHDEDDFKRRVIENDKTVIVDFYASWCGPCKILGPKLEKIVSNFDGGKVDFAKVNIDQLADLAMCYKVNSVPTVIAIRNGKEVSKFVGIMDDERLKKFVRDAIEK